MLCKCPVLRELLQLVGKVVGWLVTRVHCGQTASRIDFIFGTQVGVGHINIVLGEYPNRSKTGELGPQSFGFDGKF